jgi:hypothetical protein
MLPALSALVILEMGVLLFAQASPEYDLTIL